MPSKGRGILNVAKEALPSALKTAIWLIKITVIVSLFIVLLRYTGVLFWFSNLLSPLFNILGLPGEAALAYVTGYFVNVYSAIAVITTLSLDARAVTILSVMVLCSHNMITETSVQKKTGSSVIRIVVIRTLSAFILGVTLNRLLPGEMVQASASLVFHQESLKELLTLWFWSTLKVVVTMTTLIFSLVVVQRLLSEYGVIRWIAKFLRPLMHFFGLPAKTAFLWIVANTLGLSYGAAIILEEAERGKISQKDADLLNHHICVSHSNLEDVMLLGAIGGMVWWLILSRWAMSLLLAWELRVERWLTSSGEVN